MELQPILDFERRMVVQKAADVAVEFFGEDEFAREEYRAGKFVRDLEAQRCNSTTTSGPIAVRNSG